MKCVHCGRQHTHERRRGLCWNCYRSEDIRAMHKPWQRGNRLTMSPEEVAKKRAELNARARDRARERRARLKAENADDDDPSEMTWEEVEAMVAKQYLTLDQCTGENGCKYCTQGGKKR